MFFLSLDTKVLYHVVRTDFPEKLHNDIWAYIDIILLHFILVVCFNVLC